MPALPRRTTTKSSRKIVLKKASASEILSELRITQREWQHAKRAIASAKKKTPVSVTHVDTEPVELRLNKSGFRVVKKSANRSKTSKK